MKYVSTNSIELIRKALDGVRFENWAKGIAEPGQMGLIRDVISVFDYHFISCAGDQVEAAGVIFTETGHFYFFDALEKNGQTLICKLDDHFDDFDNLSSVHWFLEDVRAEWAEKNALSEAAA